MLLWFLFKICSYQSPLPVDCIACGDGGLVFSPINKAGLICLRHRAAASRSHFFPPPASAVSPRLRTTQTPQDVTSASSAVNNTPPILHLMAHHFPDAEPPLFLFTLEETSLLPHSLAALECLLMLAPQLHSAQSGLPLPRITCRCEIPMQLPILYSMSSSGEVTLALHGWQSTFLQNCILVGQTKHCQGSQTCGATVQERACNVWLSD